MINESVTNKMFIVIRKLQCTRVYNNTKIKSRFILFFALPNIFFIILTNIKNILFFQIVIWAAQTKLRFQVLLPIIFTLIKL